LNQETLRLIDADNTVREHRVAISQHLKLTRATHKATIIDVRWLSNKPFKLL
jgi:hypothetical protein